MNDCNNGQKQKEKPLSEEKSFVVWVGALGDALNHERDEPFIKSFKFIKGITAKEGASGNGKAILSLDAGSIFSARQ